jgi:crossover junction endodeoxyribonuclease RuvC
LSQSPIGQAGSPFSRLREKGGDEGIRRILGIDPGLQRTGYGIIEIRASHLTYIDAGVLRIPAGELPGRLLAILDGLDEVIARNAPTEAAIEKVFMNVNGQSTLLLGQARGAAICAAVRVGLPVHEYSAQHVKQASTGYGAAEKGQVQKMVQRLLGLPKAPAADAADALACAICHAHAGARLLLLAKSAAGDAPSTGARRRGGGARAAWGALAVQRGKA